MLTHMRLWVVIEDVETTNIVIIRSGPLTSFPDPRAVCCNRL